MRSGRVEPELHALRQCAEELARRSREPITSAHLLAAIAAGSSPAAELLRERRLSPEEIQRVGRCVNDEIVEPVRAALQRAHELAARMGATQASPSHLLVALL